MTSPRARGAWARIWSKALGAAPGRTTAGKRVAARICATACACTVVHAAGTVGEGTRGTLAAVIAAGAVPAAAVAADAIRADAIRADAIRADAIRADAIRADAIRADAIPARDGPAPAPTVRAHPDTSTGRYDWHLPRGFPIPAVPADNPMSSAKAALGRRLFFEPRLSINGKYSCASCHDPAKAYTDGRPFAVGALGDKLPHSAMSLINVAYNISYGWTKPELQSLEAQMLEPLLNEHPVELGLAGRQATLTDLLASEPTYRIAFEEAFPQESHSVTFDNVIKAIASFERTLIYGNSPFDRYVFGGDHAAISEQAKRGMKLFYSTRGGCGSCHSGLNFAGNWRDAQGETGKPAFADNGMANRPMRVPTLRNIALTAPYMHDGSLPTLQAVLDHYARVAQQRTGDTRLRSFDLSADERADVIAFLETLTEPGLTGDYAMASQPPGR